LQPLSAVREPLAPALSPQTGRGSLRLRTLGHASIALGRDGEPPLLLTDPWLVGSVYWRSWWLQNYPAAEEIDWLGGARYVYLTHEHPDHFHPPSIRRLGVGPTYLFPALAELGFARWLAGQGYRTEIVPPRRWMPLGDGVSILSWPLWNDDSILLIDTPSALILNLNDAKPLPTVIHALRRLADRLGKKRLLLCSYSPASVINSFLDSAGNPVALKRPEDYVAFVCRLCDGLGADLYLPFASQATYERADSRWANRYRTSFAELERGWNAEAELLMPYATLDLAGFAWRAPPPDAYRPIDRARLGALTERRGAAEAAASLDPGDVARLARKLNRWRWFLWPLIPRGFSVRAGARCLFYDPRRGHLAESGERGAFEIEVPPLTLKEALRNDHLTDLGITMVVRIRLLQRLDPRKAYGLFVLFQFDDYGHLRSPRALLRWLWAGLRASLPRRLPSPPG